MKITTILGSPRRRGNTATLLGWFEQAAARNHTIERIDLNDVEVSGCLGCDACQDNYTEPGCIQEDGADRVLQTILQSDLVVYATPVYCWSCTAQMKALLDRHYCLVKDGVLTGGALMAGKRVMHLITCGGGAEDNADLLQEQFLREMNYLQSIVVGQYVVDNCSTPAQLGQRALAVIQAMLGDIDSPDRL